MSAVSTRKALQIIKKVNVNALQQNSKPKTEEMQPHAM
jgi:hypothetical protein